jgi:hypothetical protein
MGFETHYFDWWGKAYPDEVEVLTHDRLLPGGEGRDQRR